MEYEDNNFHALDIAVADDKFRKIERMYRFLEREGFTRVDLTKGQIFNQPGHAEIKSEFSKEKKRGEFKNTRAKIIDYLIYANVIYDEFKRNQFLINTQDQSPNIPQTCIPDNKPLTPQQAMWITMQPDLVNQCIENLRKSLASKHGFGSLFKDPENENWKSTKFRQMILANIEDELQKSGLQLTSTGNFIENHIFLMAKSCPEYIKMVAKIIVHLRNLTQQKQNPEPDVIDLMNTKINQKDPWLAQIFNQNIN